VGSPQVMDKAVGARNQLATAVDDPIHVDQHVNQQIAH